MQLDVVKLQTNNCSLVKIQHRVFCLFCMELGRIAYIILGPAHRQLENNSPFHIPGLLKKHHLTSLFYNPGALQAHS